MKNTDVETPFCSRWKRLKDGRKFTVAEYNPCGNLYIVEDGYAYIEHITQQELLKKFSRIFVIDQISGAQQWDMGIPISH